MEHNIQDLEDRLYGWAIENGYSEVEARKKAKAAAHDLCDDHYRVDEDVEICARTYELIVQGVSAIAVAARTGVSRRTVYRRINRHLARVRCRVTAA